MRKTVLGFIFTALTFALFAQDSATIIKERHATGLRSNGKIYVVMAVALTILAGLFLYLIRLDKKITAIEKQSPSK